MRKAVKARRLFGLRNAQMAADSWQDFPVFLRCSECGAGRKEAAHAKFAGTMRVHQFGRADIGIADEIGEAGDGQLQLFRIGRTGKKKSALRGAGTRGFGGQSNFQNGRGGGSDCNCKRSNFRSILESRMGTGSHRFFVSFCGEAFYCCGCGANPLSRR